MIVVCIVLNFGLFTVLDMAILYNMHRNLGFINKCNQLIPLKVYTTTLPSELHKSPLDLVPTLDQMASNAKIALMFTLH